MVGGAGFAGEVAGAVWDAGGVCVRKGDPPGVFVAQTASVTAVTIKITPSTQVAFWSVVTAPRGPKAAWLTPPKAAVMSTFSPP